MPPTDLDSSTDQIRSISAMVAVQRDQGLQMRLFPTRSSEAIEAEVDLRVSDDLTGMYYIG